MNESRIDDVIIQTIIRATFIRLWASGFVHTRDFFLVFSGNEETGMKTTRYRAYDRPDFAKAECALNGDAGRS